jgi:glycerophosphoryl diester phosphodiesterase
MAKNFWDTKAHPIAIAHRGGDGAGYGKRNTMEAFRAAYEMGYRWLETDVIDTKDGVVIVAHGARTRLTARLRHTFSLRVLQGLTYEEMKQTLKMDGETIPTLQDLLKALPEAKFLVDPKTDEVVKPLADLLIKMQALDRVCVGSFRYERVSRINSILKGKITSGMIIGRNNWLKYLPMLKTGRLKGVEAIYLHHSFVSQPMLKLIHNKSFKVLVWTANSPLSIKNAVRCGADGVISDNINLLKKLTEAKSK